MLRTFIFLSSLITLIHAVNNFGAKLELGAIKPGTGRSAEGKPQRERMTNFGSHNDTPIMTKKKNNDLISPAQSPIPIVIQNETLFPEIGCESTGCIPEEQVGVPFFLKRLKPGSSSGEDFNLLQDRAYKVMKAFEHLMVLKTGDFCDPGGAAAEGIINYFGNLEEVVLTELADYLNQVDQYNSISTVMCNFKEFLKCDKSTSSCIPFIDGVVETHKGLLKSVYKLGGGTTCFNFPKIFDPIVDIQCAENTQGNCDRANPGTCTCTNSGEGLLCSEGGKSVFPDLENDADYKSDPDNSIQRSNAALAGDYMLYKQLHANCSFGQEECDSKKHLICAVNNAVPMKQKTEHEEDAPQALSGEAELLEGDLYVYDFNTSGGDEEVERDSIPISFVCSCDGGYAELNSVCKLDTGKPCESPNNCATGYCFPDPKNTTSGKICHGKLNGLLFIDTIYRESEARALSPTWIVNIVLPTFPVILSFGL